MPKNKTHSGIKKRVKVTGTGKIMHQGSGKRHNLENKSTKRIRQMDSSTREGWRDELRRNRANTLDAPSWLWSSVVELLVSHECAYLEHCRRYAGTPKPKPARR